MTSAPAGSATTAAGHSLSVVADLRLETEGQRIQLIGDGQSLILHTDHPWALLGAARRAALPSTIGPVRGRREVGRAADALRSAGLRIDVRGPAGVLIRLGDGAGSASGQLLTGSRAVSFGPPGEVFTSLAGGLPLGRIVAASITGLAVIITVSRLRHRRR